MNKRKKLFFCTLLSACFICLNVEAQSPSSYNTGIAISDRDFYVDKILQSLQNLNNNQLAQIMSYVTNLSNSTNNENEYQGSINLIPKDNAPQPLKDMCQRYPDQFIAIIREFNSQQPYFKQKSPQAYINENNIATMKDEAGNTLLVYALRNNYLEVANCLIDLGADCNAVDTNDQEPVLFMAARRGYFDLTEKLVGSRNGFFRSSDGTTIFHILMWYDFASIKNILRKIDKLWLSDLRYFDGACAKVDQQTFLKFSDVINFEDSKGQTPLSIAVERQKYYNDGCDSLIWLILHNADYKQSLDNFKRTIGDYAIQWSNNGLVAALLLRMRNEDANRFARNMVSIYVDMKGWLSWDKFTDFIENINNLKRPDHYTIESVMQPISPERKAELKKKIANNILSALLDKKNYKTFWQALAVISPVGDVMHVAPDYWTLEDFQNFVEASELRNWTEQELLFVEKIQQNLRNILLFSVNNFAQKNLPRLLRDKKIEEFVWLLMWTLPENITAIENGIREVLFGYTDADIRSVISAMDSAISSYARGWNGTQQKRSIIVNCITSSHR